MQTEILLESLSTQVKEIIKKAAPLKERDSKELNWRPAPDSWSILECLEHLNLYGQFYLPAIERGIHRSKTSPEPEFKPGFLGNYFAESMLPKEQLKKMKTFKSKDPIHTALDKTVIDTFLQQQQQLLILLTRSRKVSLNKIKIPTSISAMLQLKLGDTFRFVINHELRHLQQVERLLEQAGSQSKKPSAAFAY